MRANPNSRQTQRFMFARLRRTSRLSVRPRSELSLASRRPIVAVFCTGTTCRTRDTGESCTSYYRTSDLRLQGNDEHFRSRETYHAWMRSQYVWQCWPRFFRGLSRVQADLRRDDFNDRCSSLPCGLTYELAQLVVDPDIQLGRTEAHRCQSVGSASNDPWRGSRPRT